MKQHRLANTTYRLLHSTGKEQYRAFERLCAIRDFQMAFKLLIRTKPDLAIAETILKEYLVRTSPFKSIYTREQAK